MENLFLRLRSRHFQNYTLMSPGEGSYYAIPSRNNFFVFFYSIVYNCKLIYPPSFCKFTLGEGSLWKHKIRKIKNRLFEKKLFFFPAAFQNREYNLLPSKS